MEFWGVEVKAGQPLKVKPEDEEIIHISQATLGESDKKGAESVPIYVKFGGRKLVLGTLSADKFPQISYDLVFEKEFELSHNWKGGSVYFMGYKTSVSEEDNFSDLETDSEEEDALPINLEDNGKVVTEPLNVKKGLGNAKAVKVKSEEKPKADACTAQGKIDSDSDEDDDDDDDDDDESAEDDSDDEKDGASSDDDSDDEDDSDEDDEEETPKKVDVGKKRPIVSAKTPESKKAKLTTPQKTDGKKGVQTAIPHPAKQGSMNPASDKKNQQTQKSGGSVSCGSCSKCVPSLNPIFIITLFSYPNFGPLP
ncbi:hypothetical protein SAY86_026172 [Trapa natans]|uniref:Nucleoplasmin-like domain-containing protein n=1 Tax=Trapa natans TaxID=22666 RepID=A0AAN7KL97_TRANT|nr:hypothetical protein SAY86_026172 [Trapa natans]